jgi:hypothetical protein
MLKDVLQTVNKVTTRNPGYIMVAVVGLAFSVWDDWQEWRTCRLSVVVGEAAALTDRGSKLHDKAGPKLEALVGRLEAFPANRAELDSRAGELSELYRVSAAQFLQAASQWDRIAVTASDRDVSDYFLHRSRSCSRSAAIQDLLRKYVLLVADTSIRTSAELRARQADLDAQIRTLKQEETRLEEQAARIFAENRAKFE